MTRHKYLKDSRELRDMLVNPKITVTEVYMPSEGNVIVGYDDAKDCALPVPTASEPVGLLTTSFGRLRMNGVLQSLGDRACYWVRFRYLRSPARVRALIF